MKDHEIAILVQELVICANKYHYTQQLRDRISEIVINALTPTLAALKEAQEQEPVAWMHDKDGRVDTCHDSVKKLWLKVGQQQNTQFMREIAPCRVEHYNIPLYARPVLARAEAAESDAASWADQCSQRVADWDEMRIRAEAAEAALKEAQEQAAVAWWCGEDLTSNHDQAKWFESFTGEDALPLYASPVPAAPAVAFNISDNVDANTSSAERIDDNSSAPAVAAPAVQDDCVSQDESTMMMAASALVLYRAGESAEYMAKAIEALLQSNGCSSQTQNEVRLIDEKMLAEDEREQKMLADHYANKPEMVVMFKKRIAAIRNARRYLALRNAAKTQEGRVKVQAIFWHMASRKDIDAAADLLLDGGE